MEKSEFRINHLVFGFFGYLMKRKEYEDAKREKRLRELQCSIAARREIMCELDEDDPDFFKKAEDIKETYRKKYGLQQ